MAKLIKKCAVPALIIFLWWLVVRCFHVNAFLFPPPDRILAAFKRLIERDELQRNISTSFVRAFRGFSLTVIFAIPLGILFHSFHRFFSYFDGLMNFLRNVPPLAMIPLLILWFGIDEASKLAVIVLSCFFPIFLKPGQSQGIPHDQELLVHIVKAGQGIEEYREETGKYNHCQLGCLVYAEP